MQVKETPHSVPPVLDLLGAPRLALGAEADHFPLNGRPAAALVRDYLHTKGSVREDTRG